MPEYDFGTLSPVDFESLVRDLLREELGINLRAFAHGPDGGVDLRSHIEAGVVVVQCKHYRGSTFSQLKAAAVKEKAKVDKLQPHAYYFVTSQDLTLTQKETVVAQLQPHLKDVDQVFALRDINQMLGRYSSVEANHFKLWMASASVIKQIVLSGIWQRSEALMEEIHDRVRLYVTTPSFAKAKQMLAEKGVCVITGGPGVGKSMLADMLALAQWQDEWQIVELPSHEVSRAWDAYAEERKQFFYFDDVFGQTDIQERLNADNGKTVARLIAYLSKRRATKQLVITTRTHVLQEAESRDEPLARAQLHTRECVVQVSEYTRLHKARILYNHLYFSDLPRELVRDFVTSNMHLKVIDHANFTPRLIELTITQQGDAGEATDLLTRMLEALEHPIQLWGPSFRESLKEVGRRILMQLVIFPPEGAASDALQKAARQTATPIEYQNALTQLEGSWIDITSAGDGQGATVAFHDPSCRDFVLSFVNSQPDYVLDIIKRATSSLEIAQLLRYAASSNSGHPGNKYAGIRSALQAGSADVAEAIRIAWDNDAVTPRGDFHTTLDSLRVSIDYLDLDMGDWVVDEILRLGSRLDSPTRLRGWDPQELTDILRGSGRIPASECEILSCKYLFIAWCAAVGYYEEWHPAFEFKGWLEGVAEVVWTEDEKAAIQANFETWLDDEFSQALYDAPDADAAREWADDLREVSSEYFESYEERFEAFEHDIVERFERDFDPSEDDLIDMRAADAIQSSDQETDSDVSDDTESTIARSPSPDISWPHDEISEMFKHLG